MNFDLNRAALSCGSTAITANFRQKDGYPPGTMATRFSLWSNLRSGALWVFPYHVLLFYLAPWAVKLAGWKWRWLRWLVLPVATGALGGGEWWNSRCPH